MPMRLRILQELKHEEMKRTRISFHVRARKCMFNQAIRRRFSTCCIGLRAGVDDNESLFCLDREPWSLLPKSTVHPKSIDYEKEIVRRGELFRMTPRRPRNWNKEKRMEWLERYPVVGAVDIEFLRNEVMRLTDVWNRQVTEASSR